jgi:hypothetical protein
MFIKSQNGEAIVELKQLEIINTSIYCSICIAEYPTQERAMEVLDEIYNKLIHGYTTHQMPK